MTHPILVTGASSGIGEAYARRLARDGYDLLLVARRRERLEELARELAAQNNVQVELAPADLANDADVAALEQRISEGPALEMLINSAGFGTRGHLAAVDPDKCLRMTRLLVETPVRLVRAALPAMLKRQRGAIINVSSLAAFFTKEHYVTYSASKAYLNMFTEGLRAEVQGTGVRVQVVCPGLTRTEFLESPEFVDFDLRRAPAWAWMSPEAVVEESLCGLERGLSLCIPGRRYRLFVGALQTPVFGKVLRWALNQTGVDF